MMMAAAIVALLAYRTTYGESPFQSVQSRYRNGDPPFRWPRAYTWHEYVFDDEDGGDGVDAYSYRSSRRRSGSGSDSGSDSDSDSGSDSGSGSDSDSANLNRIASTSSNKLKKESCEQRRSRTGWRSARCFEVFVTSNGVCILGIHCTYQ